MTSVHLKICYLSLEKPFLLIGRSAHCGGTDYWTICRLNEDDTRLLHKEGISWLYGEPDWENHYKRIQLYKAERDKKEAEKRIEELSK